MIASTAVHDVALFEWPWDQPAVPPVPPDQDEVDAALRQLQEQVVIEEG